jgi:hypothetical protein
MNEPKPDDLKECYRPTRNMESAKGSVKLQLTYEAGIVTFSVFDEANAQYQKCFTMNQKLDYNGYFVISGATGARRADFVYLNAFKLVDKTAASDNHHVEDVHQRKAEYEDYA